MINNAVDTMQTSLYEIPIHDDSSDLQSSLLYHRFHNKFLSRLIKPLCSTKLKEIIFALIKQMNLSVDETYNIMDVSCGYDSLIIDIAARFPFSEVVANDINQEHQKLIKRRVLPNNLSFTNRDILHGFDFKYDLVICKNTLHHFPKHLHPYLIQKLIKMGRKVIIVDIEDPFDSCVQAFIWNFYYRKFLKDDAFKFASWQGFKDLLINAMQEDLNLKIKTYKKKTIKGNYMFATIERPSENVHSKLGSKGGEFHG